MPTTPTTTIYSTAPEYPYDASSSSSYGSSAFSTVSDLATPASADAFLDSRSSPDRTPTRAPVAPAAVPPPTSNREPTVLSLSDEALSEALTFHKEVGYGNWGSVWLCTRKTSRPTSAPVPPRKVAVKLVHRSTRSTTTTARIQALWNEVKVLNSLPISGSGGAGGAGSWEEGAPAKNAHPSIIAFEAFVLSPSYALVTMAYCERPMPVGITEVSRLPTLLSALWSQAV